MSKFLSLLVPVALIAGAGYLIFMGGGRCAFTTGDGKGSAPATLAGLTAKSLKREAVPLDSLVGKPLILDFWATWCGPCRTQRDELARLHEELGDKITIVALSVDDGPAVVQGYLMKHPSAHAEYMASPEAARAFNVEAIPTLVIVDSTGRVRKVSTGVHSAAELKKMIAGL